MTRVILAACLLGCLPASAALLVTVSPVAGGTRVVVVQTSANPALSLDSATTGFIAGIPLAGAAFDQDVGASAFIGTFSASLGTLSNAFDSASSSVNGLSFFDNNLGAGTPFYRPRLDLVTPLVLASSATHQMSFSSAGAADITFDFFRFVEGTHVDADPLYGTITTVVVPEPGAAVLAAGAMLLGLRRRRTA